MTSVSFDLFRRKADDDARGNHSRLDGSEQSAGAGTTATMNCRSLSQRLLLATATLLAFAAEAAAAEMPIKAAVPKVIYDWSGFYLGGHVGPDLTNIGQARTERDLLESIVYPSASFVRSYEPIIVVTTDEYDRLGLSTITGACRPGSRPDGAGTASGPRPRRAVTCAITEPPCPLHAVAGPAHAGAKLRP